MCVCAARKRKMYPWASLSSTRPPHQPLFYGAQLERLTYCVREWTAPRGTVVCSEGHMSAEFTFVRSGSCSVEVAAPPSSEALHLGIIGEGEFFGERSTLFHLPAEFTITAEVGVADDDDDDGAAYVADNNSNTKRHAYYLTFRCDRPPPCSTPLKARIWRSCAPPSCRHCWSTCAARPTGGSSMPRYDHRQQAMLATITTP